MVDGMKWFSFDIRDFSEEEYKKWFSLMSEERRTETEKYKKADDKKRTVAGEMLARKGIAERCSIRVEDIVFLKEEHGKPYVNLDVCFNVSHSQNMVVCAVDSKPIGIDIEQIRPINLLLAKRFCNEEELKYLFGYPPKEDDFKTCKDKEILLRFFEIWTAKEAYAKCKGTGLADIGLPMNKKTQKHIINNEYFVSVYND